MPRQVIRILSDLHFGDRASRVFRLDMIRPLLAEVDHLVLNGDTLDTRLGPDPTRTAECRSVVTDFFRREVKQTTFITGNHDADFSPNHYLDLHGGSIFAIHGDVLFENIVPWSQDARRAGREIAAELRRIPPERRHDLDVRMDVFRRVAHAIPQRHQSEKHGTRYALRYLADTVWPPHRVVLIMLAWRRMPALAAELLRRHRPSARFILTGHTHRAGIWQHRPGITVINTGSYTLPVRAFAIDVAAEALKVRHVDQIAGEFRPGAVLAEFPLAASG